MRRVLTFLIVAMAFLGAVAQVEISMGESARGTKARVEPESMNLTCLVGETVTDTVYVYNLSSSNIDPLCGFNSSPGYIWCEGDFGVIPPGGVGKSVVTYTPEAAGTHTASLSMNIGGEYYSVHFTGVATEPYMEQAAAPAISAEVLPNGNGYKVTITCAEPGAEIHYRLEILVDDEWVIGDWTLYDEPLIITATGHYRVRTYSSAPGKTDSSYSMVEFIIAEPTICYDFIEDGIYYSIIDDNKVSVSKETLGSKSYSGVVNIPNTVTHDGVTYMVTAISNTAFRDCDELTAVTIGDYVTEIKNSAFSYCYNLTSVELGDYVISVGNAAFFGCIRLESVTLGKGLKRIDNSAFASCSVLADVTCKAATPPTMVNMNAFDNSVYQSATLHVYPAVADSYKSTSYWSSFLNVVGEEAVSPKKGDTNGDSIIDINDVANIINRVLSGNW